MLVKDGTHKALLGIEKKSSKMEDDKWNNIDFRTKTTIILFLSDEALYNAMNEATTVKLERFYMIKSLSNKLFVKKQLYSLWMKEGTPILQHRNAFNRILNNLLALEVKLEEEKALLLLSSLSSSYEHLATTIMYGKETLELEDVRQMLQNNELMKKIDSTEEASGLFVKGRGKDQRVRDPKGFIGF